MTRRAERVASAVQAAVQAVLSRGLSDPRVRGLITVTGVTVTDDLRQAFVRVSIMPAEHEELTMHGLRAAAAHVRHAIGDALELRRTPNIEFRLDRATKRQAAVLEALAKARQATPPAQPEGDHEANPSEGQT